MYFNLLLKRRKIRYQCLAVLTIIIVFILCFLFYTSEDPHWGGGYWSQWLSAHFDINHLWADLIVQRLRKTLHFIGYGCIGLILWLYFFFWRLKHPLMWGWLGVLLIASLDEYTQSRTAFRYGRPQDVLLDCLGAVIITGIVKVLIDKFFLAFQFDNR